jgi:hypothetical protein
VSKVNDKLLGQRRKCVKAAATDTIPPYICNNFSKNIKNSSFLPF